MMDWNDATVRWHGWTANGTPEQITRLLGHLDTHLPTGWQRLTGAEEGLRQTWDPRSIHWYGSSGPMHDGPTLGLTQPHGGELRGGRVLLGGPTLPPPSGAVGTAWVEVIRFLNEGIGPAAGAAGVDFRAPTVDDLFLRSLPIETRDRLQQFCVSARKALPLTSSEAERWRGVIVSAYRMRALFDTREFVGWLVAQGWEKGEAEELDKKLVQDVQLLELFRGEEFDR